MRRNLPNQDPNRYAEEGYCVFYDHLSSDEMQPYQQTLDGMLARMRPGEKPQFMFEPHVGSRHWRTWLGLARNPKILDAVESVLGPNLVLILSHFIIKGTEDNMYVGWHQDQSYWLNGVQGDHLTTVWMPFNPATRQNGCMRILPKTNQPVLREVRIKEDDGITITTKEVDVTDETVETAVDIELKPGSFSLHDAYVVHGSDPNGSDDLRKFYTMRYANADSTKFRPEKWRIPFFLVRGQARNLTSYIDIRPHQSLPNQQARLPTGTKPKKDNDGKKSPVLTRSTNPQTLL